MLVSATRARAWAQRSAYAPMWSRSSWLNVCGSANDRPSVPNVTPSAMSGTAQAERFGDVATIPVPRSSSASASWMSGSHTGWAVRAATASGRRESRGIDDINRTAAE